MNRTRRWIGVIGFGTILFLMSCAKKEVAQISLAKVPIGTESTVAAEEYQKGMTFANKLQTVEAATHFRAALDADPRFARAWLNLAYVSPGTSLFISALDSAKKYAAEASEGEQLIIKSAQFGFEGNNTEQEKTLIELVNKYPGDENAHLLLGNYYFGLREYREAILNYSKATELNHNLAILHNQLGYSQRALGNYGEAEKAFKLYIRLNADNPNAYDSYAELLMEMGRFKESIEFYTEALEHDPQFIASYIGIACDYAFLGEFEKAHDQLGMLEDVARNHIDTRRALYTEALTYVCEGKMPLAVKSMREIYALDHSAEDVGSMANALVNLGTLYLEMNLPDKALESYYKSMEVINQSDLVQAVKDNAHTSHLYNIATVFATQGNFPKAKQNADLYAEEVLKRNNPIQVKLIAQLNGIIALKEEHYRIAIEELERADQLNPLNLYRIGEAYAALGDSAQAATYKLRAEELNVFNSFDQAIVLSKTKFHASSS